MATKKPSKTIPILPAVTRYDQTENCDICTAGYFPAGVFYGECRAHPQKWTPNPDGSIVGAHDPAQRDGWCREFQRKAH